MNIAAAESALNYKNYNFFSLRSISLPQSRTFDSGRLYLDPILRAEARSRIDLDWRFPVKCHSALNKWKLNDIRTQHQ